MSNDAKHAGPGRLARAEAAVYAALDEWRAAVNEEPPAPQPLVYEVPQLGLDTHRYVTHAYNVRRFFADDEAVTRAHDRPRPDVAAALLALSPHWEDRVRAAVVREDLTRLVTLPDQFPCIYEPADSPNFAGVLRPEPRPCVVSADVAMLEEALPLYRELWAAYESQWPKSPHRTFEIGRLDGIAPGALYRPGTTAADVIASTMLTHDGMYKRAPEHLRAMHPLHRQWEASKAERLSQFHAHQR